MKNAIFLRWSQVGERFTAEEKNQALKRRSKTKFNHTHIQLVLAVAQQFHVMQSETILHFIGDIPVTYEDIHRILSGITFDITDPTAVSLESFRADDDWFEGNQIEMIRALLYEDGFFTENGELKPVMITPSFYTLLYSDTFDACSWLKSCFRSLNLVIEEQLLPCTCLIPANVGGNTHWILIHVDIQKKTFFPINPYHPSTPNTNDIEVGERIALCFSSYFRLQPLICEAPPLFQSKKQMTVRIVVFL